MTTKNMTRKGALAVTADLDRLGTLFQTAFADLGVPEKVALDFAQRCDMLSDYLEKSVGIQRDANGDIVEASDWGPNGGVDETGQSVEPDGEGFDANAIGDDKGGAIVSEPDESSYMGDNFAQQKFHELRDKQEAGQIPGVDRFANEKEHKLARMVAASSHVALRELQDRLKACVAKLTAAGAKGTAPLISDAKKMVATIDKVADGLIKLDATGDGSPELLVAADQIVKAVSEVLPDLEGVDVAAEDQTSPTAMLDFENLMEDGTVARLVSLANKVVTEAGKSVSGGGEKEAAATTAKAAKAAEDDEDEGEGDEGDGKEASVKQAHDHGYDLFAA